jgi:hypothetical protein
MSDFTFTEAQKAELRALDRSAAGSACFPLRDGAWR